MRLTIADSKIKKKKRNVVSKVNKRVGLLRRVRNVLPQRTLNLRYKSLIVPHFDYSDVVWGNACKTFLSKLDRLQNAAGKNHSWSSS